MRAVRCAASFALVLVLAACGEGGGGRGAAAGSDAVVDGALEVSCGGSEFDITALSGAPSVSSLPRGPAGAVDDAGAPAFDASKDWKVVHRSDDRVELVRQLEEPLDDGAGDVRTLESRTIEQITGATNVPDGTWLLTSSQRCAARLVVESAFGEAALTLADAPSPSATTIDLLVRERACASGEPAHGRIEVVELDETVDQIRLHVGVRERRGGQTCQDNPPTAFSIQLAEPLGRREVVDASVVPPLPLRVDRS